MATDGKDKSVRGRKHKEWQVSKPTNNIQEKDMISTKISRRQDEPNISRLGEHALKECLNLRSGIFTLPGQLSPLSLLPSTHLSSSPGKYYTRLANSEMWHSGRGCSNEASKNSLQYWRPFLIDVNINSWTIMYSNIDIVLNLCLDETGSLRQRRGRWCSWDKDKH